MSAPCNAWRGMGVHICANGFITLPACQNGEGKTHYCLRESLPDHMVTDSGAPRFYRKEQP